MSATEGLKAYLDQPAGWAQTERALGGRGEAFGDDRLGRTLLGRAAFNENRLGKFIRSVCGGIGFVLKTGALLASGGVIVWAGFMWGQDFGREAGFGEGCRAVSDDAVCDNVENLGASLRRLRMPDPGKPLSSEAQEKIAALCGVMRSKLPHGIADHYGCEG